MVQEEMFMNADSLAAQWAELKFILERKKKLDYGMFKQTFAKSYQALQSCAKAEAIDKKYLRLILSAYNFINTKVIAEDDVLDAAMVLTERMLDIIVSPGNNTEVVADCARVYILEARQDVYINFTNVDEAIDTLSEVIKRSRKNY